MKLNKEELKDIYKKLIVVFSGILFFFIMTNFSHVRDTFFRYISYIRPILIGFGIAFVANMLMNFYEKQFKKYSKLKNEQINVASMVLAFITLGLIVTFFLSVVLPQFISSLINLLYQIPDLITGFVDRIKDYPISDNVISKIETFVQDIESKNLIERLINLVISQGGFMLQGTMSVISHIFKSFFEGFLAISFSIYMLSGKNRLKRNAKQVLYGLLIEDFADRLIRYYTILYRNSYNFFTGQFLEAIIMGIVVFIGITIIGAPYAMILSVTSGLLNIIPYIGAITGAILSVVLISIADPIKGLIFLVFIIIYQQIDGNYIYPKLVGGKVGIPAIWIMVAITIGGSIMGVIGMVVFVPIFATFYMILRDHTYKRLDEKEIDISKK